jgi:hypothetical protein
MSEKATMADTSMAHSSNTTQVGRFELTPRRNICFALIMMLSFSCAAYQLRAIADKVPVTLVWGNSEVFANNVKITLTPINDDNASDIANSSYTYYEQLPVYEYVTEEPGSRQNVG